MIIAFTTSGNDLTAPLEARFGRASRFLIYDLEDDTFEVIDNEQSMDASQGPEFRLPKPWQGWE